MWIIVFGLGHLGIFGYLYTSHYILLIYMRLYCRGQHLGRTLCYRAVRPTLVVGRLNNSETAIQPFVHIFTQDTLYSKEVASAVEVR